MGLQLQAPTGADSVEAPVYVEPQQMRGGVAWPAFIGGRNPRVSSRLKVEGVNNASMERTGCPAPRSRPQHLAEAATGLHQSCVPWRMVTNAIVNLKPVHRLTPSLFHNLGRKWHV